MRNFGAVVTRVTLSSAPAGKLLVPETRDRVIVDHADPLHEGVEDRGSHEAKAPLLEVLAERVGFPRVGGKVAKLFPSVHDGRSVHESPDVSIEGPEFLLHGQER